MTWWPPATWGFPFSRVEVEAGRGVACCTAAGGTLRLVRGGKEDVGEKEDSDVDKDVVG